MGKSTLSIVLADYLREFEIPFIIEELDPLETVCILTSCSYFVVKYFSINDFIYNRLKIDRKKLLKEIDKYNWRISVADMFTGVDPNHEVVKFQDSITDKNLNVFITDKLTINDTVQYALKWNGARVLIVNFIDEKEKKEVEDILLDLVYGEGIFKKAYILPYFSSLIDLEKSTIVTQIIKELLDILVQL